MPFAVLVTSLGLGYDVGFEITPGKKRKTSFRFSVGRGNLVSEALTCSFDV